MADEFFALLGDEEAWLGAHLMNREQRYDDRPDPDLVPPEEEIREIISTYGPELGAKLEEEVAAIRCAAAARRRQQWEEDYTRLGNMVNDGSHGPRVPDAADFRAELIRQMLVHFEHSGREPTRQ